MNITVPFFSPRVRSSFIGLAYTLLFCLTGGAVFAEDSEASAGLFLCPQADGRAIFSNLPCEPSPEQAAIASVGSDEETSSKNSKQISEQLQAQVAAFKRQLEESQVDAGVVLDDDSGFLKEIDPDVVRVPNFDPIEVEFTLTDLSQDNCCLRVVRGTQYAAERMCTDKGKKVWKILTEAPAMMQTQPWKVKNQCHINLAERVGSEVEFSCSVRSIAQCYWD